MACPTCGAETRQGQKFCAECGTPLARACPSCGTPYEGSPKFCAECGNPLQTAATATQAPAATPTAPAAPPAPPSPEAFGEPAAWSAQAAAVAERKQVSVLFADLVGFTTMSESRDAEEVREQLTEYFNVASEIVGRYGGTVEKFIGDAVMAVWGTPVAHEDDAERAVRAAMELVSAVQDLGGDGQKLSLRAGVLTGEAAVTLGATNQGMVAGDLVNTASRLQSVAPPGSVLVGETTYRTASRAIAFEPVGEQELKGKSSPVPAYRALRVVAKVGGVGRADQLEAPFIGRDAELRLVKDLLHATARERRPRLISIIGQGGIGKSRLTWEFRKYIDGIASTVRWHQGRSPAYGEGITFWALGEMIRSRAQLLENDDAATTRAKLAETVEEFVPDEPERRWMQPRLEQLLGISESEQSVREELFAAWRTFFERVAGNDVAVLVFEDLHWADSGLLDFIEHLLTWARSAPILIITLARPELLEKRPTWGAGQRNFSSLSLEPLPDDAIREILNSLVPGLPEDAVSRIVARAEGIPLYAVETVRMLLQDGRLEKVDGSFRPTGDLSSLAVPSTLQALIAARLDALDGNDRSLLQHASVLGQSFTLPSLAAITGESAGLEDRLLNLVRREILTLEADPRSPERGQYGFVQALVRDVAYNTLGRRERKVVHLAAAEYFSTLADEEIVDATAMHFLDAYRSATDDEDADTIRRRAAELLQRAAARATQLGSHDQAVRFLELALEVSGNDAEQIEMLTRAGASAGSAGRYEIAEGYLRRALELARSTRDLALEAHALAGLGRVVSTAGRPGEAALEMNAALEHFSTLGDDPAMVALIGALARAQMLNGHFPEAITLADRALPLAERLDMAAEIADLLITRGTSLGFHGRLREANATLRGAIAFADSYGLGWAALRARVNISGTLAPESPAEALQFAHEGLQEAERTGNGDMLSTLAANSTLQSFHLGNLELTVPLLEKALAADLDPPDRFVVNCLLAVCRALRGDPHDDLMNDAVAFGEGSDEPITASQLSAARGWVAFARGNFDEAEVEARRSADLISANAFDDAPVAARAALWAGRPADARSIVDRFRSQGLHGRAVHALTRSLDAAIVAAEGRREEAIGMFADAIRQLRTMEMRLDLAMCEVDLVRFVGGERPEVLAAAQEAREILTEIGAKPLLRRLDEALGLPVG